MLRGTLRGGSKMIPSNSTLFKANGHRHTTKLCSNCYCMIAAEAKVCKIIQIITIRPESAFTQKKLLCAQQVHHQKNIS